EVPACVLAHEIPGAKPGVALAEDTVEHLLLRVGARRVALEAPEGHALREGEAPDHLADLAARGLDAEALAVPRVRVAVDIVPDDARDADRLDEHPPDRAPAGVGGH